MQMMILLIIILITLLYISNCYKLITFSNNRKIILFAKSKANDNSNDDGVNGDQFKSDLMNLSDNTDLNKKIGINKYGNDGNLSINQQKEIVNKNIEEIKQVASLIATNKKVPNSKKLQPLSDNNKEFNDGDNNNNDNDNDNDEGFTTPVNFDASFDTSFDTLEEDMSIPPLPLSSSLSRKKNLAMKYIQEIEINKDITMSTEDDVVTPRDKAREKVSKQLTEPLPEYDGILCPLCSRPSTKEELESFEGKCSLCRQQELSEPDISLEYRYRIRDMKERRASISSNSINVTNVAVEINSNGRQNVATSADTASTASTAINNNSPKNNRWPALPEGVFNIPLSTGTMITRDKLEVRSSDKRIDYDDNHDDSSYTDEYESMENNKINSQSYDGEEDVWERLIKLENSEVVIDKIIRDVNSMESRLDSVIDTVYTLENKLGELELKYDLLEKKYLQEILSKKKNKNDTNP